MSEVNVTLKNLRSHNTNMIITVPKSLSFRIKLCVLLIRFAFWIATINAEINEE